VGLYGSNRKDDKFCVNVKVLSDCLFDFNDCLLAETKEITSDGSRCPIKLLFSRPVPVEPNRKYHITTKYICSNIGNVFFGTDFKETVYSSEELPVKIRFFMSHHDEMSYSASDGATNGLFPSLYFSR